MSGEATLSAEYSRKPLGGRGSASNPAGGAHSAPSRSVDGEKGTCYPSPRTPPPLSTFGPPVLPPMKNTGHTLDLDLLMGVKRWPYVYTLVKRRSNRSRIVTVLVLVISSLAVAAVCSRERRGTVTAVDDAGESVPLGRRDVEVFDHQLDVELFVGVREHRPTAELEVAHAHRRQHLVVEEMLAYVLQQSTHHQHRRTVVQALTYGTCVTYLHRNNDVNLRPCPGPCKSSSLGGRYNYDSTSIRRPFDCLSKVIKVTVMQPARCSHADLFYLLIYLFRSQFGNFRRRNDFHLVFI